MAKMLYFELGDQYDDYSVFDAHFILVKLAEVLVKISNLVDLRIQHGLINDSDTFKGIQRISEAIRFVFLEAVELMVIDS